MRKPGYRAYFSMHEALCLIPKCPKYWVKRPYTNYKKLFLIYLKSNFSSVLLGSSISPGLRELFLPAPDLKAITFK